MDPSAIAQMLENVDEKHDHGHQRLRRDLTEGFNDVHTILERFDRNQREDHDAIRSLIATRERRKELSGYRAVIIAAVIGGGFRLIEVFITQIGAILKGHG